MSIEYQQRFTLLRLALNGFGIFNVITNSFIFSGPLTINDAIPFPDQFFIRIAKAFPSMKYLSIMNILSPLEDFGRYKA